ncbi:GNAT family N-acetyltransferase [Bacillus infantis]|uniref:GNAT family N-acetyltransferase n=1 Tax=Bacillus infantis TaxID=324767 RepID=UPI001CD3926A|nr:GNAT family N-acetyltransferase [Bacillus infantis]MCA1038381.1 GNAT family N-acetyltransferase [Bacillus infantis]
MVQSGKEIFSIREAKIEDAKSLSDLRVKIDGETENMDRESGENFIDEKGFERVIVNDSKQQNHLFLVAEAEGKLVGFSRCEGSNLRRTSHKVEFGVCVLKDYWGNGIGKQLLIDSIRWAEGAEIKKITLQVLETNKNAIQLYKRYGFEIEGVLRKDKLLSDGKYYSTVVMGRIL